MKTAYELIQERKKTLDSLIRSETDKLLFKGFDTLPNPNYIRSIDKVSFKEYKSHRDQLIKEAVEHINKLREGTKYRKETPANLAKRVNMNKFLLDDGELEYVMKECRAKNNYSKLYWLIK